MGGTPPSPLSITRGSETRQECLLPVHGNGNSWKSELELVAHPPPTVTGQVDLPAQGEGHHGSHLPAQGEGHHGSHPPGQEDSAAKPFLTPQGAQSWTWPPPRPGGSASASATKEINTWGGVTTEMKTPAPSSMMPGRKFGRVIASIGLVLLLQQY